MAKKTVKTEAPAKPKKAAPAPKAAVVKKVSPAKIVVDTEAIRKKLKRFTMPGLLVESMAQLKVTGTRLKCY